MKFSNTPRVLKLRLSLSPSIASVFLFAMFATVLSVSAQVFPNFPSTATYSDQGTPTRGVALANLQVSGYPNELYEFYTNSSGHLNYSYSLDGSSFGFRAEAKDPAGNFIFVDTNAQTGDSTAGAGAVVVGNNIYVAYVALNTHLLTVLRATHDPSSQYLLDFQQVYSDPTPNGFATTAAGMTYNVATGEIYAMFGTNRPNPNLNNDPNEGYVIHCVGSTMDSSHCTTSDANLTSPTQSGLAFFQGALYMVQKIDGGGTTIFVVHLDSAGHFLSGKQISGSGATFRTVAGLSMLVWNNELIFSAMDRDNSNAVVIYASTDGTTWNGMTYTNRLTGATPGLALFNNGLTMAYRSHNTNDYVTYALHSTP